MTNYTKAQQSVLNRINASEDLGNKYSVKTVEKSEYSNELHVSVSNGRDHALLAETYYLNIGPRGGVRITGVSALFTGENAQERWDHEKTLCSLFNYAVFNGNATVKFYGKRPTLAEALARKQAAEERLKAKAVPTHQEAEKDAQEASEELTATPTKPQLNEYYIVFTLSGELKLVEKLRDSHELELEVYAYDLEGAREQFKAHKAFLKSEDLLVGESCDDDEEEAEEIAEELPEASAENITHVGQEVMVDGKYVGTVEEIKVRQGGIIVACVKYQFNAYPSFRFITLGEKAQAEEKVEDTSHNGWTNYETWRVQVEWMDGWEFDYEVDGYSLHHMIREIIQANLSDANYGTIDWMWEATLERVNWDELAQAVNENLEEVA